MFSCIYLPFSAYSFRGFHLRNRGLGGLGVRFVDVVTCPFLPLIRSVNSLVMNFDVYFSLASGGGVAVVVRDGRKPPGCI